MTPLLPEEADDRLDLALEALQKSAARGNRQHAATLDTLQDLLRIINSYYADLIKGHNTHPHDITPAMQKDYDEEIAGRAGSLMIPVMTSRTVFPCISASSTSCR
jgi:hypothetical protein